MITEVLFLLLILSLCFILFLILLQFWHILKTREGVESALNNHEFSADTIDTPKECIEHCKETRMFKDCIKEGKVYFQGGKKQRTLDRIDKASNRTINKIYAEYKKRKLKENGEITKRAFERQLIGLHLSGISHFVKMKDVKSYSKSSEIK